jgi:23S rRNA (adenine2503-C2)-methyltransferase
MRAIERTALWDLLPEDLRALGYRKDPAHLFGRIQRLAGWNVDGPALSREARECIASLDVSLPRIVARVPSTDGATRLLLELADGKQIESVHMPRAVRRPRVTVCLSSQVGCAMGCTFCATARMGLVRNLAAHEIVGQLLAVLRELGPRDATTLNLVFMGMGEPLHNLDALIRALAVLCHPAGLGIAPSRVTVSTAGIVPGIDRLATAKVRPELALSVNGVTDERRNALMPIGKKWSLAELREALARWPRRPHEKITLEYVVLGGVNHSHDDARRLVEWIGDLRHVLNLIPFNAWGSSDSPYREPSEEELQTFARTLQDAGLLVTVRRSRGRDARAACGTLVA